MLRVEEDKIRALAVQALNEELPVSGGEFSDVARSKMADKTPVIIVQE